MSTYTAEAYATRDFVSTAKALSDPSRVRILMALSQGELCVCQLVELLDLASSTVSRHMSILSQAYLVDARKQGRWVFYRRAGAEAPEPVRAALEWVDGSLADSPEAQEDRERLRRITAIPPEQLCRASEPD